MTRQIVERNIDISLQRMDVEALDLLQFHWWDYGDRAYLDALGHMADLQKEGKIKHLALTNFDTPRLKIIVENGIKIVSNQVQFSIVDRRPQVAMIEFCARLIIFNCWPMARSAVACSRTSIWANPSQGAGNWKPSPRQI
jgi:aryl-alcohol dehydrogenase-like predicted oxidoreductase